MKTKLLIISLLIMFGTYSAKSQTPAGSGNNSTVIEVVAAETTVPVSDPVETTTGDQQTSIDGKTVTEVEKNDWKSEEITHYSDGSQMIVQKIPGGESVTMISADRKKRVTDSKYTSGVTNKIETVVNDDGSITSSVTSTDAEGKTTKTSKTRPAKR